MVDSDEDKESANNLSALLYDHSSVVPLLKCLGILFSMEPYAEVALKGNRWVKRGNKRNNTRHPKASKIGLCKKLFCTKSDHWSI